VVDTKRLCAFVVLSQQIRSIENRIQSLGFVSPSLPELRARLKLMNVEYDLLLDDCYNIAVDFEHQSIKSYK